MFFIKADTSTQRLNVTIQQIDDAEDLKSILFIANREVIKLNPGWTAALDFRGMGALEEKLMNYLKELQRSFLNNNVGRIVTLVDNVVLKMQLILMGKESGAYDISSRFSSEKEWKAFLASPPGIDRPTSELF